MSYALIESVFRQVLAGSKTFKGRFYVLPHLGSDLNSSTLGSIVEEGITTQGKPSGAFAAMIPPRLSADYTADRTEVARIVLLLLDTTHHTAGAVKGLNRTTNTSKRTIPQEWQAMKNAGVDLLRVLTSITDENTDLAGRFRLSQQGQQVFQAISEIGNDRYSGVMLQFDAALFTGCEPSDYSSEFLSSFQFDLP